MSIIIRAGRVFLFALVGLLPIVLSGQTAQEYYIRAQTARAAEDYATYRDQLLRVDSLRPDHPVIKYELGIAYAWNDQHASARTALARALWLNPDRPLRTDSLLQPLRTTGPLDSLYDLAAELQREIRHSEPAFTLADTSLHPEGVVAEADRYFVSSVHHGKVVTTPGDGTATDFATLPAGYSAMGLAVDTARGWLWVAATATPNHEAYVDSLAGRAALYAYRLDDGREVHCAQAPTEAWLGDVIVGPSGAVYTTSSSPTTPAIYRSDGQATRLERILDLPDLVSLQGLCLDTLERNLFFSDYRYGLFRCDLLTATVTPLRNETPHPLKGIDGLYSYRNWLIAIHNGLRPFQVTAYRLSADRTAITDFVYLDKALPEMGEPTLGTIVGDWFYYVVNSPWGAYSPQGELQTEGLAPPRVHRLHLSEFFTAYRNR